jgi:hypothetical protein
VVESTALEMRHTGNRIGGSNPSLSATPQREILETTHARTLTCSSLSLSHEHWTVSLAIIAGSRDKHVLDTFRAEGSQPPQIGPAEGGNLR